MKARKTFTDSNWVFTDYQAGLRGEWHMPENSYPILSWQPNSIATATVPDVTGMSLSQAQDALTGAGIMQGEILYLNSWTVPANIVTSLSACIGGTVDISIPIDIYVSLGRVGDGTDDNPYNVSCQADLYAINSDLSANYLLVNDICMSHNSYYITAVIEPNAVTDSGFSGVFDGNGHVIKGLTIDTEGANTSDLGLFGKIEGPGAEVKNLGLEALIIAGGFNSSDIGSLCGVNEYGSIKNCYAAGIVEGGTECGGLCGSNGYGTIINCYSTGTITGKDSLGGLCGVNGNCGNITNSFSTAAIIGEENSDQLGGICGLNKNGIITNCFWNTETSNQYIGYVLDYDFPGFASNIIGKTISEMQTQSTFTDARWIFADYQTGLRGDWYLPEGRYPVKYWQNDSSDISMVPDVTNMTLSQTQDILIANGLSVGEVLYVKSWTVLHDVVTGLSVSYGSYIDKSVPVDIYISVGGTGDGTQFNPYEIASQIDIDAINTNLSGHYILTSDINMSYMDTYENAVLAADVNNIESGFQGTPFTGSLDGNNHVIHNITIDTVGASHDYLGLFGIIGGPNAIVENLTTKYIRITGGHDSDYIGGLCGIISKGYIRNCSSICSATAGTWSDYLGGLCGTNAGFVKNSYSTGSISGGGPLGGLCGLNTNPGVEKLGSFINNSCSNTNLAGGVNIGGLCGVNYTTIRNSYSTGNVTGNEIIGGLCGSSEDDSSIINCYATGKVTSNDRGWVGCLQ